MLVDDFRNLFFGIHNADHLINKFKNTITSLLTGMVNFSVELS